MELETPSPVKQPNEPQWSNTTAFKEPKKRMELETPRNKTDVRSSNQSSKAGFAPDSLNPTQRDLAFKNFGVMDTGHQDKKSVVTSVIVNGSLLALFIAISLTATKVLTVSKVTTLTAPVLPRPEPPPPPKPLPRLPKPPVVKVEPPKPIIHPPVVEVPEPPKIQPPVMKASPVVANTPAPPKAVTPPPAPKPVAIQIAQATSVANNNANPSPVRLGSMTNPIHDTSGPAVSPINLGRAGAPGMPGSNTGLGPASKINISGSGSPNGTNMAGRDNSAHVIKGLNNGIPGGTGPLNGRPAGAIQIASNNAPPAINKPTAQAPTSAKSAPKVLFKPHPVYTEDARQNHIEGTVYVKIHVTSSGTVQVLGISSGLGHGLDQSAVRAAQEMRFQPASQDGRPVDWDGVVNINFQIAS